jgi:UDP-N-acetylglucosamine 2-epimerase (non-hydrolysing)
MKIINIVGARPNFMKIAPLMSEFKLHKDIKPLLVHTGQHYDKNMSDLFFDQLGIPFPDINLGVGSGTHAVQTAEIMKGIEPVFYKEKPDAVLVVGDVNSTIACGLVAVKLGIKVIHVEAGLRSNDRKMPEEINRILTDSISDLLFCTEESGVQNLIKEGVSPGKIHFVGHVMIDTLLNNIRRAKKSTIIEDLKKENKLKQKDYVLLTLHRPSNVDNLEALDNIVKSLEFIAKDKEIIFPIHPRTRKMMKSFNLLNRVESIVNLQLIEPVGYLDFIKLMSESSLVLTDSGGIQEETTALRIPCITLRENTERPITVTLGSNQLVGSNPEKLKQAYSITKQKTKDDYSIPPLWDGKASKRIVNIIKETIAIDEK